MGCFNSDTKPKASATYGFAKQEDIQEALEFALNKGEGENLSMQLELHLSCANLKNMDTFSLTDSVAVIYLKDKKYVRYERMGDRDGDFKKVGQTELVTDSLNPVYVNSILIDYQFEETQEVQIAVYDLDDFDSPNVEQELIGSANLFLHDVVRAQGNPVTLPLKRYSCVHLPRASPKGSVERLGDVIVTGVERKRGSRSTYKMQFEGYGFEPENLFYKLYCQVSPDRFVPIFESETAHKQDHSSRYPFKEAVVHSAALIRDDESRKAMIEVFQWCRIKE